jgi:hypothetical protein
MSKVLESLHKILKDPTRRKILLSLNEKRELTYTDLMEKTGVTSTGPLNYHLRVLGDLLTKNEAGQYMLTEKGKTACNLLLQFPEPKNSGQGKKWSKKYWAAQITIPSVILVVIIVLFFTSNIVSFWYLLIVILITVGAMVSLYFRYMMTHPRTSK